MIRGWCPSLHEPMATGDGLLVRVKPPLGRVSAVAARRLAAMAVAHGNGAIELTGRGALQFRGLAAESAGRFAAEAVTLGLAVADRAAERRRSVLVAPFAGAVAVAVAWALEAAVVGDAGLAELPAKFGFAVDDGALPLGVGADLTVVVRGEACAIVANGVGAWVGVEEVVPAVVRMAHAFLALAGDAGRMRGVAAETLFAACGLRAAAFAMPAVVGAVGRLEGGFGVGVPFGSLDAAGLVGLAGIGEMRLTPWRAIVFAGAQEVEAAGLIVDPGDARLLVSACVGRAGCGSASVETRGLAAGLRPLGTVHVSGCSKGCAHPGVAGITLVGREGGFDVVRGGRAGDVPQQFGLRPEEAGLVV